MKAILAIILASLYLQLNAQTSEQPKQTLQQLLEQKDFFSLKERFETEKNDLAPVYESYFSAALLSAFNHPAESNAEIEKLLKTPTPTADTELLKQALSLKLQNHVDLGEYAQAAKTSRFLTATYTNQLDSTDLAEYENAAKIWEALRDYPPQEISRAGDFNGQLKRDKMGLFRIDTQFGEQSRNLVFDTGANFSVMQRSVAEGLGLKIIPVDFLVTAATGQKVKSQLAVAPEIEFGGLQFRNVVFLVFNDSDLSFPQIDYQIEGIIGFPVIKAMGEIRIGKNNSLFVPQTPSVYSDSNFALDGLMPIVAVNYKGDRLRFHFDTGATSTILFPAFYKKYNDEIDRKYKSESFQAGSAGGEASFNGFTLNKLKLKIGSSSAELKNVRLQLDETGIGTEFDGNLGQDFIKQFDEMVISFRYSAIRFNKKVN